MKRGEKLNIGPYLEQTMKLSGGREREGDWKLPNMARGEAEISMESSGKRSSNIFSSHIDSSFINDLRILAA